jgi:hypothetical protein
MTANPPTDTEGPNHLNMVALAGVSSHGSNNSSKSGIGHDRVASSQFPVKK